jgi:uncharacterized repeat protein (TIGR02543 family)
VSDPYDDGGHNIGALFGYIDTYGGKIYTEGGHTYSRNYYKGGEPYGGTTWFYYNLPEDAVIEITDAPTLLAALNEGRTAVAENIYEEYGVDGALSKVYEWAIVDGENDGWPGLVMNRVIPPPKTYAFTVVAGADGAVSGTASGSYEQGTAISVTAAANSGYHFTGWTADGVTLADGAANPAAFSMPANAVTLTANFAKDEEPKPEPEPAAGTVDNSVKDTTDNNDTSTIDKNVTKVRTPLASIYLTKGASLTPPVCADSVNPVTKKAETTAKLTWKSSNVKVATVSAAGKIKAKKVGKATITIRAMNGKSTKIKVTVVKKATKLKKLTLKKPPKTMKVGKTAILKLKLAPAKATNLNVKFKVKGKAVKVDKAGKITAVKKGKAKITVSAGGKKIVRAITVK